jgi:hypothetical protein
VGIQQGVIDQGGEIGKVAQTGRGLGAPGIEPQSGGDGQPLA